VGNGTFRIRTRLLPDVVGVRANLVRSLCGKEEAVTRAIERQGWDFVKNDPKTDRNRAMKTRQRAIGRELRRIYEDVAKEPVPDEFVELLRQIDRRGGKGGQTDS
jgi:hypothetical protein